jgi:hypothetical protein
MTDANEVTVNLDPQWETPKPKPVDINDVDASWDGAGSLDEHRQAAFEKLKQPGFGRKGVTTDGE